MANWWEDYKKKNGVDEEAEKARQKTSAAPQRASSGQSHTQANSYKPSAETTAAAQSPTWWEDYKRANDIYGESRTATERAAYMEQERVKNQQKYERYMKARNQLDSYHDMDATEDAVYNVTDRIFGAFGENEMESRNRDLKRATQRYERDFPVFQKMLQSAPYSHLYQQTYEQASSAYDNLGNKFDAYNDAIKSSEEKRLINLYETDRGAYYGETMPRQDIETALAEASSAYEQAKLEYDNASSISSAGYSSMAPSYQTDLKLGSAHDQDRKNREAAIASAKQKMDDAQATLAQYERAITYQDEQQETARIALMVNNVLNRDDYIELAEKGKAAFDASNQKAFEESNKNEGGILRWLEAAAYSNFETSGGTGSFSIPNSNASEEADQRYGYNDVMDKLDAAHLTKDEKDVFYALWAENQADAMAYIDKAKQIANERHWAEVSKKAGENWGSRKLNFVGGTFLNLLGGVFPYSEFGQYVGQTGEAMIGGVGQALEERGLWGTGLLSGEISEDFPILGGKSLADATGLASSMLQSSINAGAVALSGGSKAVEWLGLTIMGGAAANSDYRKKLAEGWSQKDALAHSIAAGIAEAAFEELSIDKLVNQNLTKGFWKNFFQQAGIEMSEEVCTTIANRLSDAAISAKSGNLNEVDARAYELMSKGMNGTEARKQAEKEWIVDLVNDGLGGFISGGLMTAGNYAIHAPSIIRQNNSLENTAQHVREAGSIETLQKYAADNDLGWYAKEQSQGDSVSQQTTRNEAREQRRQDRQIGSDVQRVQDHIQDQISGKSLQEQQEIRDQLQDKYGDGILPSVYQAISIDAAQRADKISGSDAIREARNKEAEQIQDADMRRAVVDGYDQAVFGRAMHGGDANEASRYFQQLRNTSTGDMTMEATVEGEDGQSKQVAITGMSEDGKSVVLSDGVKIAVKNLQADADTMDALQQLVDLDLGKDADAVLQAYRQSGVSGTEGYRWLMDYATAYNQGRTNQISLEEAVKRSSLDQRTVMDAYTLGQREAHQGTKDAVEALKKMPKKEGINGKTSNIDTSEIEGITLNESEREQFEFANKIFSLIGVDVKWVASAVKNGRFVGANGSYLNGAVTLDVHAGRNFLEQINSGILATTGHELTHFLQQYAPEQYRALKEFLFRQIVQGSANGEFLLERLIWEKQRRASSKLSRRAAEDEVVADACQTMLRDSKAIREFAQQDEEAAKGVVRWLDKWFGKLKQAFSRSAQLTEEARFVDGLAQEVRDAFGKLWDEALREAVRVHDEVGNIEKPQQQNSDRDTENQDIRYSERDSTGRELSEGQKEYFKDSKIRDKYGNLLTLYHGTAVDFTVFDLGRSGKNYDGWSEYGSGIYLTPDKKFATYFSESASQRGGTPKLMELYANIKNPFNVNDPVTVDVSEYAKKYKLTEDDVKFLKKSGDRWLAFMREHNEDIYDFLTSHGYDGLWDAYGTHAPTQIVAFTENQVKNSDNKNPTENLDIRFSMRDPVEQTDRLIAWHNMNEDALRSALELGGLAMPSWAIKTADRAHTSYGKISVIAPRELVDPKLNRSSMIFGGDAWTPVFPDIDYDVSFEAAEDLYDEITGLIGENVMRELGGASIDTQNIAQQLSNSGGSVSNYYKNNVALRYAYLKSIGKDINVPRREVRLDQSGQYDNQAVQMFADRLVNGKKSLQYFRSMTGREVMQQEDLKKAISDVMVARHGEEVRDLYAPDELSFRNVEAMLSAANRFFENGGDVPSETDRYALAKEIDKVIDEAAYEKWIGEKLNKTVTKKGVYNGKDPFTPSGNRRSFDALHYAYNLANIVKAMKSQPKQGRTQFLSAPGSVKGAALKSYNTVEQVRKDRGRLVNSAEEGQAAYDAYNRNLEDILDRMSKNGDRFDAADALIEVFQHAKTETAIYNYMQRELKDWYNISRELAHDAFELIGQINALPMEYFEGKTYDAVRFDETAAVVVPDNIDPALKQQIEDAGARVVEYAAGDDTDRLAKVNSVEGAQFSERDYSLPSDLELMDRAIEGLSEAGGEEYWKALLETDPGLAEDVKGYKDQARKLAAAEKRLADYKKQMQLGGNRKLNTRGITSLSLEMMKTLDASNAKGRGVAKQVTQTLTSAYQKALDAIDKGTSDADAWDIVYNEGVVPAAEIIAKQGTHSEKTGRGWITTSLESYYGEGGMQAIIDTVAGYVGADFATNRYRKAIQPTIADRIVERTEKRMQKQVDAATERATEAEHINKKLTEDRDFWKNQQAKDSETVTFLNERLKEARQDLRDNKSLSSQERRKLAARINSLQTQLQAKREEIRALKSLSQQLDKQAVEFGQKQAKLLDKLEQQAQRERDILAGKLKPLGMQRLLKDAREQAAKKAEQHKDEVFRDYKDRQQQAKLRGRIKNLSDEMKRRMTNPSESAYVPASLYGSMTQLCDALDDLLSPGTGTKAEARYRAVMDKIHGLAAEYQAVKDLDDPTYSSEYDEQIQYEINELVKTLNGRTSTTELSTEELQKVYNIMKYINYCMTTAKDLMGSTQFKDVYSAMRSVVNQQQGEKSLKSLSHHEKAKRMRMLDNLSVMRAVEMMSGWDRNAALYQLFHAIEQGTDASWAWVMDYNKSLQGLKTGTNEKAYRKALTEALDFGITDEEGLKVTMTKMQAIQILMTAEREAHNDKLLHLQTGGAVIRNAEDIQNGKGAKATSQTVKVTPELLQKIQDSLTDWDRAYMKAVRSYFQKEGRRTNEIMYKLKHRVLQTEEYYVPYSVDKNYLETNLDERQAMSMWVKTPGSTNALQQKAKQPVIIDGMDAVMERHVKEIADYIGLALPIRDFSKVYNGMLKTGGDNPLPVKETIDRAFGSKGQHLLTQAVIDVQGGSAKQNWSSGISDFLSGLQSAFVRSALLINPSVTIKQAASYIAAESILSHRALVAGNRATFSSDKTKSPALIAYLFANPEGKTAHRIYNEIDRYTSLHYQRRLGMSQAEIANEANRTGKLKRKMNMIGANMEQSKIGHAVRKTGENLNPVTWIQRMDVATTAALWVACKEQAKLDGMKAGTAEFWQRTTELYERCLRETQPMYDGLHRTAHQKQAGGLVQFLFPFRTVPIQNHGQLAASYETLKASKNKSKAEQAEAKRFFAKTVWAQTESAFIFSMMTFIAAALKRKTKKYRDEDEEITAESFAKGLMNDVGSTLFSVLVPMYGSELVNIGSRALDKFQGNSGYTYDAFSVGVVDMLNDLASSFDKIAADFGKIARGEDVSFGDVGSHGLAMLLKAAKLAGIPADTVRTYFNGIVGNVEDIANGRIPALNDESWERATGVNAKRFYEAWEAGDEAKMQTVLNEVRQSGKSEDSIANAFNSYAKDAYENNGLSLERYADYLDKTGMFDAEKISGKVKNLVRDEFQAGERSEDEAISALTGICGMDEDAAWKTVQRWEAGAEHEGEEDYSYSQYEDLREALDAGKSLEEAGKEYLAHGYTEEQIATQAVSWLKDQVTAGKIKEDRAIQLLRQYKGMDADKAWKKVQEWKATAAHADDEDYSWSQYDDIDAAIDGNKDIKALVKQLTSHGVEEKNVTSHIKSYLVDRYVAGSVTESALKNQLSRYLGIVAKDDVDKILRDANCKKQYGVSYSGLDEEYRAGNASSSDMRSALMKYGGLSSGDADKKIRWYDLQKSKPDLDISEGACNSWYDGSSKSRENGHESAKDAGMSIEQYLKAKAVLDEIKDSNGNRTGEDEVIAALSGMNLTARQKDALYYERYKGTTKYSRKTW